MFAARTPPHMITLVVLTGLSLVSLNMFAPSLASAFMGLLAALYVLRIDRREGVVTG
jgi:hypothetical protein